MKFVLYSDIHAQLPQLEAVQAEIDKENADKEIVIGDLIMLGPQPSEVVDNIRARTNTDVVVGNLDLWVVNKRWETDEPHSPHQAWMFEMAKQTRDLLSQDQLDWLGNLPFSITYTPDLGHDFFIFHGTPHDIGDNDAIPLRLSDDEVKEKIRGVTAEVMSHGHIHGPYVRKIGDQTIVNVAAVGMQWDGDPRPSYGIVEYLGDGEWHTEIKHIEFDCEKQATFNENCWIEHGDRIAGMIRSGYFWNPDHMPH